MYIQPVRLAPASGGKTDDAVLIDDVAGAFGTIEVAVGFSNSSKRTTLATGIAAFAATQPLADASRQKTKSVNSEAVPPWMKRDMNVDGNGWRRSTWRAAT